MTSNTPREPDVSERVSTDLGRGASPSARPRSETSGTPSERQRCGAVIEREWPGHKAILSRRYCKAYAMKGFAHCRHHLTATERHELNELIDSYAARVSGELE